MAYDVDDEDRGLLVPPWWEREPLTENEMNAASIFFGFALAVAIFAAVLGGAQTASSWTRRHRVTKYILMIWLEWINSVALACITWLYLRGFCEVSLWVWFFMLLTWSLQVQFLLQIIINRLGLLVAVPGRIALLKWGVAAFITSINISVFCIWIPARLQISEHYIRINEVWDRMEKALFAATDASLSVYFIYLVRSDLIKNGLKKYTKLYYFNLSMIFVSISLDICIIGLMSLPNNLVYLQFHPVAYLMKLVIEMKMAELIGKIAKASNALEALNDAYTTTSISGAQAIQSSMGTGTRHLSTHGSSCNAPQEVTPVHIDSLGDRLSDSDPELGAMRRHRRSSIIITQQPDDGIDMSEQTASKCM